jgi:hypothetical protein
MAACFAAFGRRKVVAALHFASTRIGKDIVKRIAALFLGLVAALPAGSVAPPTGPFLCIVEQATGFTFDGQTKSWRQTSFSAGEKLILKRTDQTLHEAMPGVSIPVGGVWAVWHFGDERWPQYICKSDFSEVGVLWCESSGVLDGRFGLNIRNHRFITDSSYGYIQAGMPGYRGADYKPLPEGSNTPSIEIGTCAAL